MFVYGYRIYDRHRRPVVSLAVLCDDNPRWRPDHFEVGAWGSSLGIRFLTVKLLDHGGREAELERDPNPFAPLILAHLKAQETRGQPGERWRWKVRLVRGLYDRGLSAEQVRQLFRLIDWMLQLPEDLQQQFREEIHRFEEERRMPYVTSIERLAREEGRREGYEEGRREGYEEGRREAFNEGLRIVIASGLEVGFGAAGKKLLPRVRKVQDEEQLRALIVAVFSATTLEDVKRLLR